MLRRSTTDSKIIETLKDLTRHRADIVSACVKYSNKLTVLLDQSFPGFRNVFSSLRIHSALAILSEYPGPQEVRGAGLEAVRKTISKACGRGPG